MNKLVIIGNLTKDPELRSTTTGISVCSFTVAVNRRHSGEGQPEADFFNVTAWRERAEICAKFLQKGKKVCVVGAVSCRTWETENGKHGANLEVVADEIEFLSPRVSDPEQTPAPEKDVPSGFSKVETDELPF